ncbi:MAG: hypothetical protein IKM46_01180 [Clostridia bacterium]|nr:hypothetical protein [Clostridia bacterium]
MEPTQNTNNYLSAVDFSSMTAGSRSLDDLAASSLSQTDLVIYAGSKTGTTGTIYGNLVDATIAKGAFCTLGWTGTVNSTDMMFWLEAFFDEANGTTANIAAVNADNDRWNYSYVDLTSLQTRYWGTSKPQYLYLDGN